MKVVYQGPSDLRELSAEDIHKGDENASFRKTTFRRGEPTEVDDQAGAVLLNHELFAGEFEEAREGEASTLGVEHDSGVDDALEDNDVDLGEAESGPEQSEGTTTTGRRGRTSTSSRTATRR